MRDDQGHFAPAKARADPMKPPAAVLARRPDSEELDHGAHDPRGSLRIDDGSMKIAGGMRLRGLLQVSRAVGQAPTVAPGIGAPSTPTPARTSRPRECAAPSRCRRAGRP